MENALYFLQFLYILCVHGCQAALAYIRGSDEPGHNKFLVMNPNTRFDLAGDDVGLALCSAYLTKK